MKKTHDGKHAARVGLWMFVFLVVQTVVEYIIAIGFGVNLFFMAQIAFLEAGLILVYFMHLPRVWKRTEEDEE